MPGIGYVSLGQLDSQGSSFSFDESVCGMLFDTCCLSAPFEGFPLMESYFGNNQVQLINNIEEAEKMGLSNTFMNGVPYYHIRQFYQFIGADAELYVMFSSCLGNGRPNFNCIQSIQQASNGRIFQLGVWTEQSLWKSNGAGYDFTELLGELESQAEVLSGVVNKGWGDGLPLSIILNAGVSRLADIQGDFFIDHKKLPNATKLHFSKISIVLGQNGTEEVHQMQMSNRYRTPVGFLGIAMACLCIASAEQSIAYVDKFNINKNDNILTPELGFGDIMSSDFTSIKQLNHVRSNNISLNGYILPVTYKSKESGVFFSNDQTLSERDFSSISLNRMAHKCRRIIRSVMFPYVNGNVQIDRLTGGLSPIESTKLVNAITERLDANMINPLGQEQLNGRYVVINNENNILETDELDIDCYFVPVGSDMIINAKEMYVLSE